MLLEHLNRQLLEIDAAALRRQRRCSTTPCAPHQLWQMADATMGGKTGSAQPMLAFCSNDYLGLAQHPALVQAWGQGAQRYGVGSGASHLVSGHSLAHAEAEALLAASLQAHIPQAQALLFCSGYMANVGLLGALADAQTTLFCDKLNHASLIDGARLAQAQSKAQVQRYPHAQLDALERQLQACSSAIKLIVTDTVFSMDGDVARLPELLQLAERYDAYLVLDDAHGLGVLGANGRGSLEYFQLCSQRFIYMGTLGKAAGVAGAFVAAHPSIIDFLLQRARTYIYTTAMPPAMAHTIAVAWALIGGEEGAKRRAQLAQRVAQLQSGLAALVAQHPNLTLLPSDTPIQALVVGDNARALALQAALEQDGLRVPAIRPPTVPVGTARLRLTLCADHSHSDVQRVLGALSGALAKLPPA